MFNMEPKNAGETKFGISYSFWCHFAVSMLILCKPKQTHQVVFHLVPPFSSCFIDMYIIARLIDSPKLLSFVTPPLWRSVGPSLWQPWSPTPTHQCNPTSFGDLVLMVQVYYGNQQNILKLLFCWGRKSVNASLQVFFPTRYQCFLCLHLNTLFSEMAVSAVSPEWR